MKKIDSSTLFSSVNSSTLTIKKHQSLEESMILQSKKQHTLPTLGEKKVLLTQIHEAIRHRFNDEITNSIYLHANYNKLISTSCKAMKSKPTKRKRVMRQQSVLEREINENCLLQGRWKPLTPTWSPPFREFSQMVNYNGQVHILGGFGNSVYNDFYTYDIVQNTWKQKKPVIPRYGHTMTVTNYHIYIIGGEQVSVFGHSRQKTLVNEIHRYDGQQWNLVRVQGILQSRKYHASATYRDCIIIVGGEGSKSKILGDTNILDLNSMKISSSQCNQFQQGILHHAMVEGKDYVYLFGGINSFGDTYEGLFSYNFIENWRIVETIGQSPPKLTMHTMMYNEPFLLIYGGKIEDITTRFSNEIYGLKDREWFRIAQDGVIPPGRAGHTSCITENKLLIFGGFNLDGFQSSQIHMLEFKRLYQANKVKTLPSIANEIEIPKNQSNSISKRKSMIIMSTRMNMLIQ